MSIAKNKKEILGVKYKAVLSNRIYLSRTKELHDLLLEELTYVLPAKRAGMPAETYCDVTRINDNVLSIPSGRLDLIPSNYEIVDKRVTNPVTFPKFKFTLREDQQEVYEQITDNSLINANPSWGKTFTGIAIATKLGQKTLVVVHTKKLFRQWIGEIKKTLGIKAGMIGDGKYNIDSKIVVGINRSLSNKMMDLRSEFGTIILDEVHHLPATVFKTIIDNSKARYKIGLSATMWRRDGKHIILQDYTGLDFFQPKDNNRYKANIFICNSGINLGTMGNKTWAHLVNELVLNSNYVELVLNLAQAQVQRGHKVLVVSDRVEFLELCGEILPNFQVIAGDSADIEPDLENYDGIFGTYQIFAEGVNQPVLSSLIMAFPINNRALLEQLIGRIERPCENKLQPEAIDIALDGKLGKYQLTQRINFYYNNGYNIKYV